MGLRQVKSRAKVDEEGQQTPNTQSVTLGKAQTQHLRALTVQNCFNATMPF